MTLGRGGLYGRVAARLGGAELAWLLEDLEGCMEQGMLLKEDRSVRVVRTTISDVDLVIKRYRYPDPLRALRRGLRPSRARRAWQGSMLLESLGIGVAPALAWLERRHGPLRRAAWLITGFVEGRDALETLVDPDLDSGRRERLIGALAATIRALQRAGVVHGDLKASNLLLTATDEVVVLDLHGVHRPGALRRVRKLRRDRDRFLRNWVTTPALLAAFEDALDADS